MPKLNKSLAAKTEEAEVKDFTALPAGVYTSKLLEVEVKEGLQSGKPYWNWTFEVDGEEHPDHADRRLWVITSLSENALFKLKEVFHAFGYTTDSDTDELIGEKVKLVVIEQEIEKGKRKGQIGNQVEQVLPLAGSGETATGSGGASEDDDLFEDK